MATQTFILSVPVSVDMEDLDPNGATSYAQAAGANDPMPGVSPEENRQWLENQWKVNCGLQQVLKSHPEYFHALLAALLRTNHFSDPVDLGGLQLPDLREVVAQTAKISGGMWHFFPEGRAPSQAVEETAEPLLDAIRITLGTATLAASPVA